MLTILQENNYCFIMGSEVVVLIPETSYIRLHTLGLDIFYNPVYIFCDLNFEI